MKVKLKTLRKASEVLFDHLEALGITEVEVDSDYYWIIPYDDAIDVYKDPTVFHAGQLSSDWEKVQSVASGKSEPIAYVFVWVSALLRYIGEKVVR